MHSPGKELRRSLYMSEVAAKKSIPFYFFLSLPVTAWLCEPVGYRQTRGLVAGRAEQCRECRWPQPHSCPSCLGCAGGRGAFGIASSPSPARTGGRAGGTAWSRRPGRLELPYPRASPEEEEEEGFHRAPFPAAPVSVRTRNPHRRVLRRH